MSGRIEWVRDNSLLLAGISTEFRETRPFEGITIGAGIHLEPKTVALLMVLQDGGARVVATGNLNSTQPESVAYLRDQGVEVVGDQTTDEASHDADLRTVLAAEPDLLLDNGGDLFIRHLERPVANLRGGTEETTSGRARLEPLRDQLQMPILVINDSPIKQFAENRHAVGQGVFESFLRITNLMTHGRTVAVFGYGECGKGVAENFRNAHAEVFVVELDPVARLEACLDGFAVPTREDALRAADVIVTVTGADHVVTANDVELLKDGAVLCNAGHFPWEIDVSGIDRQVQGEPTAEGVRTYRLPDQRCFSILAGGHMVNLAGPRPLGNSMGSMDLGYALQARCLEAVALGNAAGVVVPVPASIDAAVANAFLSAYRGVEPVHGPATRGIPSPGPQG
jgi:adenosylhomocysteinase